MPRQFLFVSVICFAIGSMPLHAQDRPAIEVDSVAPARLAIQRLERALATNAERQRSGSESARDVLNLKILMTESQLQLAIIEKRSKDVAGYLQQLAQYRNVEVNQDIVLKSKNAVSRADVEHSQHQAAEAYVRLAIAENNTTRLLKYLTQILEIDEVTYARELRLFAKRSVSKEQLVRSQLKLMWSRYRLETATRVGARPGLAESIVTGYAALSDEHG